MRRGYKSVRDMVKTCPLPLIGIEGHLEAYANEFLPYDTGIEIECDIPFSFDSFDARLFREDMRRIPVLHFHIEDRTEIKFRLPKGIDGMIALFNALEIVKIYCKLNPASGIHYHIDMSGHSIWRELNREDWAASVRVHLQQGWVTRALRSWGYKGKYNKPGISSSKTTYVRMHEGYKTVEFRIGEMTFDYSLIMKRIIHCQNITRKLQGSLMSPNGTKSTQESGPKVIGKIILDDY